MRTFAPVTAALAACLVLAQNSLAQTTDGQALERTPLGRPIASPKAPVQTNPLNTTLNGTTEGSSVDLKDGVPPLRDSITPEGTGQSERIVAPAQPTSVNGATYQPPGTTGLTVQSPAGSSGSNPALQLRGSAPTPGKPGAPASTAAAPYAGLIYQPNGTLKDTPANTEHLFASTEKTVVALHASSIEATAVNLPGSPLTRNRDANLKYVELRVKNGGPNIAVVLGNAIHAQVGTEDLPAAPASASEMSNRPQLNRKGNEIVMATIVPFLVIPSPITYELLTPGQHSKRSLGTPIGRDGARFEVEAGHFGIRVIMPGDESTGWISIPCPEDRLVKSLTVPVAFTRSGIPAGTLVVPVGQTASK